MAEGEQMGLQATFMLLFMLVCIFKIKPFLATQVQGKGTHEAPLCHLISQGDCSVSCSSQLWLVKLCWTI